jgi:hypothetical protein
MNRAVGDSFVTFSFFLWASLTATPPNFTMRSQAVHAIDCVICMSLTHTAHSLFRRGRRCRVQLINKVVGEVLVSIPSKA